MKFRSSLFRHCGSVVLLVLLLLTACGVPTPDVDKGNSQTQSVTTKKAPVESIEILILESFPVQVHILARGNLADRCTEIDRINQRSDPENNIFWVEITTVRLTDAECTVEATPFEENIPLDVYDLPAGTYIVDVNGVRGTFTLDVDNTLTAVEHTPMAEPTAEPAALFWRNIA